MRQVVLDTETTGLIHEQGHRIVEIGCVELINRRLTGKHLHVYLNPEREVEAAALEVHGLSNEFLADKPLFSAIARDFVNFISGAELLIHNAPFDLGFLDHELSALAQGFKPITEYCTVLDTLVMARKKHPGQKNNLDALCKRYGVDNTQRELHGALLDAEILADVYLMMTGGQSSLSLGYGNAENSSTGAALRRVSEDRPPLRVIRANDDELQAHAGCLQEIDRVSDSGCLWLKP
ncbi:MAG: DNA polymerase III subunit epsilon [Pseudomonadales bacterium]|nr:DNA polymerase III subunit epsilon [Pseudomonadales bacterium]